MTATGTCIMSVVATNVGHCMQISIDTQIIERTDKVVALEAVMNWGDIGSWAALSEVLPTDEEGNLIAAEALKLDAKNNIVYGPKGKLLALVGVEDLVVVDTEDALLVCSRSQSQRVKEVMEQLKRNAGHEHYT